MKTSTSETALMQKEIKKRSMFRESMGRLIRNKTAIIGFSIIVIVVVLCLLAPVICPEGYDAQVISDKFQPIGHNGHLLGTDALGRSMLARILYGGRVSLVVAIVATAIAAVAGIILGATAAYFGGYTDNIIMRIIDILGAIPALLLAIAIAASLGASLFNCMLAVGVSAIPAFAKTVRGPVLATMEMEYIEAAHSIDAKDIRIIFKHVLPNVLSPIIVQATSLLANSIILASAMSFLGLGVQAPVPEWGALIASARQYIRTYSYLVTIPGCCIAIVVLSLNLFGDGLRDALDPRLKD